MPIVLPIFASGATSRARARMVGPITAMAISVFALSTIFAASAQAAEAGASQLWGPLKAPARISAFDWTGFYVGGHVGYARGNARVKIVDDDLDSFRSSFGSLTGGLQGGYNYVLPSRLLLGIEVGEVCSTLLARFSCRQPCFKDGSGRPHTEIAGFGAILNAF